MFPLRLTAMYSSPFCPTRITFFFARVMPVYSRFRYSMNFWAATSGISTTSYSLPMALWMVVAYASVTFAMSSGAYSICRPPPKSMPMRIPSGVSFR